MWQYTGNVYKVQKATCYETFGTNKIIRIKKLYIQSVGSHNSIVWGAELSGDENTEDNQHLKITHVTEKK